MCIRDRIKIKQLLPRAACWIRAGPLAARAGGACPSSPTQGLANSLCSHAGGQPRCQRLQLPAR
eukprot:13726929-Alexandrium_andersonii.AAC.1